MSYVSKTFHQVSIEAPQGSALQTQCQLETEKTTVRRTEEGKLLGVKRDVRLRVIGQCALASRHELAIGSVDISVAAIAAFMQSHEAVEVVGGNAAPEARALLDAYRLDQRLAALEPDMQSEIVAAELRGAAADIIVEPEVSRY